MLESLRAFGYSLPTAVADLLDNSLTAGATRVAITMHWAGRDSWLRIEDDGHGMDEATLREAMRPGTRNPREERNPADLGRFGLGLKTASFSQARRLSVRSKSENAGEYTRCWDLDLVQHERRWALLRAPPDAPSEEALGHVGGTCGTIVLWEKLDRLVGDEDPDDDEAHRYFLERANQVRQHLGLVFHRWITPPQPVRIHVNRATVPPIDPFMADHPATQHLPDEAFGTGIREVRIQPYILPHQSKMRRPAEIDPEERPAVPHQGFYIYRNRRLLVPGDWLGFYRADETHQLARIRVDITNALDEAWKIDVRKAQAHPPDAARRRLRQIADATRLQAAEVYRHRGKILQREAGQASVSFTWLQTKRHGRIVYKINREYPLISSVLDDPKPSKRSLESILRLIEETIPINFILGTFEQHASAQAAPFDGANVELRAVLEAVAEAYRKQGLKAKEIRKVLLATEPFNHYPEIVASLDLKEGNPHGPHRP